MTLADRSIMYAVAAVLQRCIGAGLLLALRRARAARRKVYVFRMVGIMALVGRHRPRHSRATAMWQWSVEP